MSSNLQSHFVVVFDHMTGEFSVDWDTAQAVFPNGPHFRPDGKFDEWEVSSEITAEEYGDWETACEVLTNVLDDCPGVDVEE